jgi:hypothetical protein
MSRIIRCIEGHVFDAEEADKCPVCGWTPPLKGANKAKLSKNAQRLSPIQSFHSAFQRLTALMDSLLKIAGIPIRPGVSAGIVCAIAILLCVTVGFALPGSHFWRTGVPTGETTQKSTEKLGPAASPGSNSNGRQDNQQAADPAGQSKRPTGQQNPARQDSAARTDDQIEVGGENTVGFGAIAYSPSRKYWGEAFGYRNRNATEKRALKECSADAPDCQVVASFYRQCGAVVDGDNGIWGAGLGPTPQLALQNAIATCMANNNGKECEIERITCTR